MLAQGAHVKAFEDAFARETGRKHGVAVANGTAALHIALLAHNLGAGGGGLFPPLTFFPPASPALPFGAKPGSVVIYPKTDKPAPQREEAPDTPQTSAPT